MMGEILAYEKRCSKCDRRGPVILETERVLTGRDHKHIQLTWKNFADRYAIPHEILILEGGLKIRSPYLQERFRWGLAVGICIGMLIGAALGFATGALV